MSSTGQQEDHILLRNRLKVMVVTQDNQKLQHHNVVEDHPNQKEHTLHLQEHLLPHLRHQVELIREVALEAEYQVVQVQVVQECQVEVVPRVHRVQAPGHQAVEEKGNRIFMR